MLKVSLFGFIFTGCEKEEPTITESADPFIFTSSTLGDPSLNSGTTGHIHDYFYDLEQEFTARFYRYYGQTFADKYDDYLSRNPPHPTIFSYKSYPDLILDNSFPTYLSYLDSLGSLGDTSTILIITPDSPDWLTDSTEITIENIPSTLDSSGLEFTITEDNIDTLELFKIQSSLSIPDNVDNISWFTDLHRYKFNETKVPTQADTINYTNTITRSFYTNIIPEKPVHGAVFVDQSEWVMDENPWTSEDSLLGTSIFTFSYLTSVEGPHDSDIDSLIFTVNTDCNDDGEWTSSPELRVQDGDESNCVENAISHGNYTIELEWGYCKDTNNSTEQACCTNNGGTWNDSSCDYGDDNGGYSWGAPLFTQYSHNDTVCHNNVVGYNSDSGSFIDSVKIACEGDINNWVTVIEAYCDRGNDILDPIEYYVDINSNGQKDDFEPFEDRNCNGDWDDAETEDIGNGIWDDIEAYTDRNENGQVEGFELHKFQEEELIVFGGYKPDRLLVDWSQDPPVPILNIIPGDSIQLRHGETFYTTIFIDSLTQMIDVTVDIIDSIVTVFNNVVIETGDPGISNLNDYYITKSEWTPNDNRFYDYLILREDTQNIYQLVHPSYFSAYNDNREAFYGFNYSPDGSITYNPNQYSDGFWFEPSPTDEILFYTYSGQLRDGEEFHESYYDTTGIATYLVEKTYKVSSDSVTVPAAKDKGELDIDGAVHCFRLTPEGETYLSTSDCPSVDTTFSVGDCFKITRNKKMTMIGTGVELEEENRTWLVRGMGIVKDELYVRWTEAPITGDEVWLGHSKIELFEYSSDSERSSLSRLLNRVKTVNLNQLGDESSLENDPYIYSRTFGIQRMPYPIVN